MSITIYLIIWPHAPVILFNVNIAIGVIKRIIIIIFTLYTLFLNIKCLVLVDISGAVVDAKVSYASKRYFNSV